MIPRAVRRVVGAAARLVTTESRCPDVVGVVFLFGVSAWIIAVVVFAVCFTAAEVGYRLGRRGAKSGIAKKEHLGAVQAAAAALLGLLLAFSVSMAVTRFEARKVAVVDEANAIGTAYLRASLLPEPQRTQAEEAFEKYVDVRLELARPDWYLDSSSGLREEEQVLQRELWSLGVAVAEQDQRAVTTGLYIQAVNETIDSAARRDAGLRNHVPESTMYMIFAVAVLTLGLTGYTSGLTGGRSLVATLILSLIITAVVFVILDFDRPYRGIITVNQQSMVELRDAIRLGLPLP
jgi:hypothetical protein